MEAVEGGADGLEEEEEAETEEEAAEAAEAEEEEEVEVEAEEEEAEEDLRSALRLDGLPPPKTHATSLSLLTFTRCKCHNTISVFSTSVKNSQSWCEEMRARSTSAVVRGAVELEARDLLLLPLPAAAPAAARAANSV